MTTTEHHVDYMPLADIKTAPRNPKEHDDAGIARSIGHHGIVELPTLDERTGQLVAGHGRLQQVAAMHAEGKTAPAGVRVAKDGTWLLPVLRGWSSRSDDDAESYLIGSNQLTANAGWDDRLYAEVLGDLAEAQLLDVAGVDPDDYEKLIKSLEEGDKAFEGEGSDLPAADGWPVIKAKVSPELHERFMHSAGDNDTERIASILDAAGL